MSHADPMTGLTDLLTALPGAKAVGLCAADAVLRVHTDTRSLQPGDLFVALRGERFDAHHFLHQARAAGAVAAVVQGAAGAQALAQAGLPGWVVPDSLTALGQLAQAWRQRWCLPLIAVVGSNGKTTTTQMIASVLRAAVGPDALATQGNLNNAIGVPLTLLRLRAHHRLAVVELGMNHPGEMAVLAALARPTVAVMTNAQREHQEFMGSVEAVARENAAVWQAMASGGVAVYPADDTYAALWADLSGHLRQQPFAAQAPGASAVVTPPAQPQTAVWLRSATWQGDAWALSVARVGGPDWALRLRAPGRHNVRNALAALAAAQAAGVADAALVQGLADFAPVAGRSRVRALRLGGRALTLIDDSYNANPDSVAAAIAMLAELPAPRLLVLGDMGEVGSDGPAYHREALALAQAHRLSPVLVAGPQFTQIATEFEAVHAYPTSAEAALVVQAMLADVASVLVKGSRFMAMERVVAAIESACLAAATGAPNLTPEAPC